MVSDKRFTIRHVLVATFAVAVLITIPMQAGRVSLSISLAFWAWLAYNALVFAVVTAPFLWFFKAYRPAIVAVALCMFLLNFMPELVSTIEFSVSGDNAVTGHWLAEKGLDYDPLISIPCHFRIVGED